MKMLPELLCVAIITSSAAVILWCLERRQERSGYRKTIVTTYSDDVDAWKILELMEHNLRRQSKISKLN